MTFVSATDDSRLVFGGLPSCTHTHGQISHFNDHHGPFNLTSSLLSSVLRLSRTFTFNDSLPVDDLFLIFFTLAAAGSLLALSHQLLEQIHALDPPSFARRTPLAIGTVRLSRPT